MLCEKIESKNLVCTYLCVCVVEGGGIIEKKTINSPKSSSFFANAHPSMKKNAVDHDRYASLESEKGIIHKIALPPVSVPHHITTHCGGLTNSSP
jgi:hypothetical protein